MKNTMLAWFVNSGMRPGDSEDEKLRKSSLTIMSVPFAMAGLAWGVLYFSNGLYLPGLIPFSYGIISLLSFVFFRITKRYRFYRGSQIALILLLPFLLQLTLGGFMPSSAVIIWAIISPLGAMIYFNVRQSLAWFVAFVLLVVFAYAINDILPKYFNWEISEQFINMVFLMNILAVSSLIYSILFYFVGNQQKLKGAIEQKSIELKEQSEKLLVHDEMKSRFFANISHEFRTPLTLILGLVNKHLANPATIPSPDDSQTIKRNSQRLLQLINQLLDLSKLESGEMKLELAQSDILQFTRRVGSLFESSAGDKQIEFQFNGETFNQADGQEKIIALFDQEKMQDILTNLIGNALKFTPEKGSIEVTVRNVEKEVVIAIGNTGPVIPAQSLPHLFDRFYQEDSDNTREHGGTGIGLALVMELIQLHDGSVEVTSADGLTTFEVSFPIGEINAASTTTDIELEEEIPELVSSNPIQQAKAPEPEHRTDLLDLLIVEDNADLRTYISSILSEQYHVLQAVNGVDGLEKAEQHIPDLIISDVMMPKMNGYELCQQLKTNEKTNHIPVILLTAKASRENKLEGLETGADDYLIKPFDEEELNIRVKNLIQIREQLQLKYQHEVWLKPKEVLISSVHQKFLEDIKTIMETHVSDDTFSVDQLGHEIGMSRSQLHRKLKALTDQSTTAFIRNYRLHRAAEMIAKEAGNITEIAYSVGFSSQTYFSSSFHEVFGCSPSEYVEKERVK